MTDERTARMGLAAANDAGDVNFLKLVRKEGAPAVWDYIRAGKGKTAIARRAAAVDVDVIRRRTEEVGARFVIPGDEQWPERVGDLAWSDPVGGFGGEPLGLWVSGPADLSALGKSVAMVGSRASTAYGEHVAADWAVGIAEKGYVIISGGAYGIDACSHRGALAAGGVTVAVMAGGLAQFYPPGNSALLDNVRKSGGVVSEYPPDHPPSRARFLVRNRLIAALSSATVIVEGAVRSGAQNTINWALSLERPVLAVPGPVTSAMSATPHRLIRSGEAILATSPDDVLAVLAPIDSTVPDYPRAPETLFDSLTETQKKVADALPARRGIGLDELSVLTGESALSLQICLTHLAQMNLAQEASPGMWKLVSQVTPPPSNG